MGIACRNVLSSRKAWKPLVLDRKRLAKREEELRSKQKDTFDQRYARLEICRQHFLEIWYGYLTGKDDEP